MPIINLPTKAPSDLEKLAKKLSGKPAVENKTYAVIENLAHISFEKIMELEQRIIKLEKEIKQLKK